MKADRKLEMAEEFAVKMINLFKHLSNDKKEFVISNQILRSGTSIGANIAEAYNAESNSDYIHKLSISLKEASETAYWLRLLKRTDYIGDVEYNEYNSDITSIRDTLTKIINACKAKKL